MFELNKATSWITINELTTFVPSYSSAFHLNHPEVYKLIDFAIYPINVSANTSKAIWIPSTASINPSNADQFIVHHQRAAGIFETYPVSDLSRECAKCTKIVHKHRPVESFIDSGTTHRVGQCVQLDEFQICDIFLVWKVECIKSRDLLREYDCDKIHLHLYCPIPMRPPELRLQWILYAMQKLKQKMILVIISFPLPNIKLILLSIYFLQLSILWHGVHVCKHKLFYVNEK